MTPLEDHIADALQKAHRSGELKAAPSWGRPLAAEEGYDETPLALRMPYKILKGAGIAPPEITLFHQLAELREQLEACAAESESRALKQAIGELQLRLTLRLEGLRQHAAN